MICLQDSPVWFLRLSSLDYFHVGLSFEALDEPRYSRCREVVYDSSATRILGWSLPWSSSNNWRPEFSFFVFCPSHVFDQVNDISWQEERCCHRLVSATARAGRGPLWHWYVCKQHGNWIWATRSLTGSRRGHIVIWCVHVFSSSPRRGILRYNPLHLRLLQGCTFHSQCQSRCAVSFLRNA